MTNEEVAWALMEVILGGEPFNYPCGCFGVIVEVHKWNANWVRVKRAWPRGCTLEHGTWADGKQYVSEWRTREGEFIPLLEWREHIKMSEYVYGRERSEHRSRS